LFATIAERDPQNLQLGYVTIEFVCNNGIVGADVQQNLRDLINQERREVLEDRLDEDFFEDEEEEEDEEEQEHAQGE